ncbi:beta-lactamase/transpeptidase-like protein, partial [Gymnopilus junonius]
LAGLKLIEQGKLAFDTPVADYIPQLRDPVIVDSLSTTKTTFRPAKNVLIVRHLFNFTSGLFYPQDGGTVSTGGMHLTEWFNMLKGDLPGVPLKFEPGTDCTSDVLGFVIEKASGQTLEQFFKEHIFKALDMESSFYLTPELKERFVDLSWREKDGSLSPWSNQETIIERPPNVCNPLHIQLHLGGVGLYSSMRDYLKLLRHLLKINAGIPVANPILTQESVRSIWVPALPEASEKSINEFFNLFSFDFPYSLQRGTAMAINQKNWPNQRKKGVAFWAGYAGTEHFIDPANGIAVVFGVQILPWGDKEVARTLYPKLEQLIYAGLEH